MPRHLNDINLDLALKQNLNNQTVVLILDLLLNHFIKVLTLHFLLGYENQRISVALVLSGFTRAITNVL